MQRRGIETLRLLDIEPICPAAERIRETPEGPTVFCRIERSTVSTAHDPTSLAHYCCGVHVFCPTWREVRQTEWASADPTRLADPSGIERSLTGDDLLALGRMEADGDARGADALRQEIIERRADLGRL